MLPIFTIFANKYASIIIDGMDQAKTSATFLLCMQICMHL